MKREGLQTENKGEAQLIEMLQELKAKLDRTPDIYDWVLSTDQPWWEVFSSWSEFLKQSGLSNGKTVVLPEPGEAKLYAVLQELEHRTKRTITESDWYLMIDGGKNEKRAPAFYKYFSAHVQRAHRWPRQRWDTKAYLADKSNFYRPVSTKGCWLSFRYAAGLQNYTADDLLVLGLELLKKMRNISSSSVRTEKFSDSRVVYTLDFDGVSYAKCEGFSVPRSADGLMCSDMLRIFLDFLPHLAIYDYYGTLESYVKAVFQAYDDSLRGAGLLRDNDPRTSSVEELIASIKAFSDELSQRIGMEVRISIV